jgi:hypothetical protein
MEENPYRWAAALIEETKSRKAQLRQAGLVSLSDARKIDLDVWQAGIDRMQWVINKAREMLLSPDAPAAIELRRDIEQLQQKLTVMRRKLARERKRNAQTG